MGCRSICQEFLYANSYTVRTDRHHLLRIPGWRYWDGVLYECVNLYTHGFTWMNVHAWVSIHNMPVYTGSISIFMRAICNICNISWSSFSQRLGSMRYDQFLMRHCEWMHGSQRQFHCFPSYSYYQSHKSWCQLPFMSEGQRLIHSIPFMLLHLCYTMLYVIK